MSIAPKNAMSIEAWSNNARREAGRFMLARTRIYLDMRFWIDFCEVERGNSDFLSTQIYGLLTKLVESGKVICPLSYNVFSELLKQNEQESRLVTAGVMDRLSLQYCFISPEQIHGQEIICFIDNTQMEELRLPHVFKSAKYVWTKIPFVFGERFPSWGNEIDPDEQLVVQRAFLEHLSSMTLVEIMKYLNQMRGRNRTSVAEQLNLGKDKHQNWGTFKELFLHEVAGLIDGIHDELVNMSEYVREESICAKSVRERFGNVERLSNEIYIAFAQDKVGRELAHIHIPAKLHAQFRYDKPQRYDANDLDDIGHSAWAIPYCDYFLTERKLADMIRKTKLDSLFDTNVLSKQKDVIEALSKLL
jgi:hypothetical protein